MNKLLRLPLGLTLFCMLLLQTVSSQVPDDWKRFGATQLKNSIYLSWETYAEYASKEFTVQHSINGHNWTTIGTVKAQGQSGTVQSYKYQHTSPVNGLNFYRIILLNENGRGMYSRVVHLEFIETIPLKIFPNPVVNGVLNLQLAEDANVTIFTRGGRAVLQKHCTAGKSQLFVNDLPTGLYQVKAGDEVKQFFIQ